LARLFCEYMPNARFRVCSIDLLKLFVESLIKPEVSRVYRLEEISQVLKYLESGKSSGKLIIKVTD